MAKPWRRVAMQHKNGAAALNITSLMDVMTIILIFLLFSFSSQDQNLRLAKDMELPRSSSEQPFKWAINITLTHHGPLMGNAAERQRFVADIGEELRRLWRRQYA